MTSESEFKIDEVFESAVTIVRNLPKDGPIKPSDELKLKLYAYFKQATCGPNDTPKPKFYQFVESYKWDAWSKLGDMPRHEAMSNYISELKQVIETIPKDDSVADGNKLFEDVLGKKFYDYWFNEWNQRLIDSKIEKDSPQGVAASRLGEPSSSNLDDPPVKSRANDTQSNSSGGSSMSMLEDTQQSPEGDGYKTPQSLGECNITGQVGDQFALAVLRLQHSLDTTNSRLGKIETQLWQTVERVGSLEEQTFAKQPLTGSAGVGCPCGQNKHGSSSNHQPRSCNKLFDLVRRIDTVHWFFLSYPLLVYMVLRMFEKRKKRISR